MLVRTRPDPGDSDVVSVYATWTGAGSLDGLTALTADNTNDVTFQVPNVVDDLEIDASEYLGVGMTQTVEFQIVDDADLDVAAEGLTVTYEVSREDADGTTTFTRTAVTDATGLATDSFSKAGDAAVDTITVQSVTDADGDDVQDAGNVNIAASQSVTAGWFVQAESDAALATTNRDDANIATIYNIDYDGAA